MNVSLLTAIARAKGGKGSSPHLHMSATQKKRTPDFGRVGAIVELNALCRWRGIPLDISIERKQARLQAAETAATPAPRVGANMLRLLLPLLLLPCF